MLFANGHGPPVVRCARSRAHRCTGAQFDAVYHEANATATRRLAQAALTAGVRRFVFASTVKVNGEATLPGRPFRRDDAPAPQDAYARSKAAAEAALVESAAGTPM